MAVPSSWNDLVANTATREHVGLVWYERECFVPVGWRERRAMLYVGSANHHAVVWLNGKHVGEHEGGHLPFHLPLDPSIVEFGRPNRLTIALNNTLSTTTIPPGFVQTNVAGRRIQRLQMDFFHYAGLHRQVMLYSTPTSYLDDILVSCRLDGTTAHLNVFVSANSPASSADASSAGALSVLITLRDATDRVVARGRMPADPRRGGRLQVPDARLWWPRYMGVTPGYLYTIVVEVLSNRDEKVADVYRLKYGIRTVEASPERGFLINGRPFYFAGFGKHEDSELRGRGLDTPQLIKDMGLLDWTGANSVRTTHYPYSEEFLQLCDENGIAVIDEAPAVGLQGVNMVRETLKTHLEVMGELITRDKNHPSVVMWSVANEPDSEAAAAATYFKHLVAQTKALDPSRPVTFASFKSADKDVAAAHVDVIMVNRYHAWYTSTGQLDIVPSLMRRDLTTWHRNFRKPIMISEFGADSVAGVHSFPSVAFSEEFQADYLAAHYSTFDEMRHAGIFIGEHVWNFADFMTSQGVTRVVGNRKGVFTRSRQPKLAAHTVRSRYLQLANESVRWPLSLGALVQVTATSATQVRACMMRLRHHPANAKGAWPHLACQARNQGHTAPQPRDASGAVTRRGIAAGGPTLPSPAGEGSQRLGGFRRLATQSCGRASFSHRTAHSPNRRMLSLPHAHALRHRHQPSPLTRRACVSLSRRSTRRRLAAPTLRSSLRVSTPSARRWRRRLRCAR